MPLTPLGICCLLRADLQHRLVPSSWEWVGYRGGGLLYKAIFSSRTHLFKTERELCEAQIVAVSWPEAKMSPRGQQNGKPQRSQSGMHLLPRPRWDVPSWSQLNSEVCIPCHSNTSNGANGVWKTRFSQLRSSWSTQQPNVIIVGWKALGYKLYSALLGLWIIRIFISHT